MTKKLEKIGKLTPWEIRANAARVLAYFEKYPEMHNQTSWFSLDGLYVSNSDAEKVEVDESVCNSTMCAAGTVVWLNDGPEGLSLWDQYLPGFSNAERDARVEKATKRAAKYLGLSDAQAQILFIETDNHQARAVLERIALGKKNIFKGVDDLEEIYQDALDAR